MKHIKVFEDFFKYYKFSTNNENVSLWGYTREDIEDLFLEITDQWALPVSIDFVTCPVINGKISGENISTDKSEKLNAVEAVALHIEVILSVIRCLGTRAPSPTQAGELSTIGETTAKAPCPKYT